MLQPVATVRFTDLMSQDKAIAVVRAGPAHIALALSLERDGDLEVIMTEEDCRILHASLESAIARAAASVSE